MPANAVKHLIRRLYLEMFRDPTAAEQYISPDYVDHNYEHDAQGPRVFRAHVAAILQTFPDFTVTIEDMIAEADMVATRLSAHGTHTGTWMQVEPTGSIVRVEGINIDRVANGLVVEHWGYPDTLGMLSQMGVDPFAAQKETK